MYNTSAAGVLVESAATLNQLQAIFCTCWAFSSTRRALAAPAATLAEALRLLLDGEALSFSAPRHLRHGPKMCQTNNDIVPHQSMATKSGNP